MFDVEHVNPMRPDGGYAARREVLWGEGIQGEQRRPEEAGTVEEHPPEMGVSREEATHPDHMLLTL